MHTAETITEHNTVYDNLPTVEWRPAHISEIITHGTVTNLPTFKWRPAQTSETITDTALLSTSYQQLQGHKHRELTVLNRCYMLNHWGTTTET